MAHFTNNISVGFPLLSHPVTSAPICIKQPRASRQMTIHGMFNNFIHYLPCYGVDKINKSHFLLHVNGYLLWFSSSAISNEKKIKTKKRKKTGAELSLIRCGTIARRAFERVCGTFAVLIVKVGAQIRLKDVRWSCSHCVTLTVIPVMKSVERNEAFHLGFLHPT